VERWHTKGTAKYIESNKIIQIKGGKRGNKLNGKKKSVP
jgi:hypothetical protein